MAIEYVGGQTQALEITDTTVTFALTGGLASKPANGDVVIVSITTGSATDDAIGVVTSGYTELVELYVNAATYDTNLSTSWKRMGSSPDTSVVVTGKPVTNSGGIVVVQVYRGVDATTPFDATTTSATIANSAIPNPPAITPVTSGAWIVAVGANCHARGASVLLSASYLSSFTTLTNDSTGRDSSLGMGYVVWASGAYNPAAWAFSGTDNTAFTSASVTMALRPASTTDALTSTNITTAAPTLDNATIAQTQVLASTNVETTSPTLDTATLVATSLLDSTSITTGAPTVDASTISQTHILTSVEITTGTPTLDAPTLTAVAGTDALTSLGITTDAVTVDAATIAQTHALSNTNSVSGTPTVGVTTIHVTSILVSTNVETGAPTLGLPDLVDYARLTAAYITTGSPTVDASTINQIHVFTSVPITTGIPELPLATAFSQGAFNASYERKRTVWVMAESRTVIVSKEALPTVVTAERENRTATIQ